MPREGGGGSWQGEEERERIAHVVPQGHTIAHHWRTAHIPLPLPAGGFRAGCGTARDLLHYRIANGPRALGAPSPPFPPSTECAHIVPTRRTARARFIAARIHLDPAQQALALHITVAGSLQVSCVASPALQNEALCARAHTPGAGATGLGDRARRCPASSAPLYLVLLSSVINAGTANWCALSASARCKPRTARLLRAQHGRHSAWCRKIGRAHV